ncbi:MAG: NUDIX domain-containing protein [Candidatus Heimdallarchaeota archaeon]|nr:MAG: NUDIX domain-containing protein [Candidatus Heimdallarchaeota archaeon]
MSNRKYPQRPWVSAHGIIFDQQKEKILLTKRAAPPKALFWFPPGGAIDLGETVEEGLKREILEETDIVVKNLQFINYIDGITPDSNGKVKYHFVVFMFEAEYFKGTIKAKDDALDVKWVSIEDIMSETIPVPSELISILKETKK